MHARFVRFDYWAILGESERDIKRPALRQPGRCSVVHQRGPGADAEQATAGNAGSKCGKPQQRQIDHRTGEAPGVSSVYHQAKGTQHRRSCFLIFAHEWVCGGA